MLCILSKCGQLVQEGMDLSCKFSNAQKVYGKFLLLGQSLIEYYIKSHLELSNLMSSTKVSEGFLLLITKERESNNLKPSINPARVSILNGLTKRQIFTGR